MRKIEIGLKPSPNQDLEFLIYRADDIFKLPNITNNLLNVSPIAKIDESSVTVTAYQIRDAEVIVDPNTILGDGDTGYLTQLPIIRDIGSDILVSVLLNDNTTHIYSVSFSDTGDISQVLYDDAPVDSSISITGVSENVIYIHSSIAMDISHITVSYYTSVIMFTDEALEQTGVEYYGPEVGSIKPITLHSAVDYDRVFESTSIPYLKFQAKAPLDTTTYYYKTLAQDTAGNLSDPSNTAQINIMQDLDPSKAILMYADYQYGVSDNEQAWISSGISVVPNAAGYTTVFKDSNTVDSKDIYKHQLTVSDIQSRYSVSDGKAEVALVIPNLWEQRDRFQSRHTKAWRIQVTPDDDISYTQYSNTISPQDIYIGIERIAILRTEVTEVSNIEIDLPYDANNGTPVAQYLKYMGRYYDAVSMANIPVNHQVSSDPNIINIVIPDEFTYNSISVFDINIEPNKIFRYDIYSWDDYNTESKSLSIYVTTV